MKYLNLSKPLEINDFDFVNGGNPVVSGYFFQLNIGTGKKLIYDIIQDAKNDLKAGHA